jgi:hypothetical protein
MICIDLFVRNGASGGKIRASRGMTQAVLLFLNRFILQQILIRY